MRFNRTKIALLATAAIAATPAMAQETASSDPAVAPAPTASETRTGVSYTPADFARFAPRTATDLIQQIPGYSYSGTSNDRGLGQASENLLINGKRVANKSGGAYEQLSNTPIASVVRVDIVDAAQLGIAGLTGVVANVILEESKKGSGSFEWRPEVRAHYADPNFFRGKVSYNDSFGPTDYSITVDNQANRGAFGGGVYNFRDAAGLVYDDRDLVLKSNFTQTNIRFRTKTTLDGGSVLNASVAYRPYRYRFSLDEEVTRTDGSDRFRTNRQGQDGFMINVEGDYEFDLGPGKMKLIGTRFFEHEPTITEQRSVYLDLRDEQGVQFERDAFIGETVARAEYKWKSGKNDWQLSAERATNRLRQNGKLSILNPSGVFEPVPYPGGSGEVREERYEAIASFSRPLSAKLDLQLAGGGEYSTLERVDGDVSRSFFRPKGSAVLGWRPTDKWDASLSLKRSVGQISFYDFLSQPNLQQDRESLGNSDLVPQQAWEGKLEVGRNLGPWGKLRFSSEYARVTDIIDIIPLGDGGEGVGNLPSATIWNIGTNSTIQLDPIGIKGAKFDIGLMWQDSRVRDPLTGELRPISGLTKHTESISFRHDIPNSNWAYSLFYENYRRYPQVFPTQISSGYEGPFTGFQVENKDVLGMTVSFDVINTTNAPNVFDRTVYQGYRDRTPIAFTEHRRSKIGPIFRLGVKGNF